MNPLFKFLIARLENKTGSLREFLTDSDNYQAMEIICDDIDTYLVQLKEIVTEVL